MTKSTLYDAGIVPEFLPSDPKIRRQVMLSILKAEAREAGMPGYSLSLSRDSSTRTIQLYFPRPLMQMTEAQARDIAAKLIEQCDLLPRESCT